MYSPATLATEEYFTLFLEGCYLLSEVKYDWLKEPLARTEISRYCSFPRLCFLFLRRTRVLLECFLHLLMVNILPQVFALFCIFPTMECSLGKEDLRNLQKINSDPPLKYWEDFVAAVVKCLNKFFWTWLVQVIKDVSSEGVKFLVRHLYKTVAGYLEIDSKQTVLTKWPTMQIRVIVHVHAE